MSLSGMTKCGLVLATAFLLSGVGRAFAGTVTVPVSQDATVNAANPNANLNSITTKGGLLSGLDTTGSDYQFYLKFLLPTNLKPEQITAAKLIGTYTAKYGNQSSFHQLYLVNNDNWDENTITYNNRPATGDAGPEGFNAVGQTPGTTQTFDITPLAKNELAGDHVLSLAFATIDGRLGDLEYFASKEFGNGSFRVELSEMPSPIPLPTAVGMGLTGLCVGGLVQLRKHQHRVRVESRRRAQFFDQRI